MRPLAPSSQRPMATSETPTETSTETPTETPTLDFFQGVHRFTGPRYHLLEIVLEQNESPFGLDPAQWCHQWNVMLVDAAIFNMIPFVELYFSHPPIGINEYISPYKYDCQLPVVVDNASVEMVRIFLAQGAKSKGASLIARAARNGWSNMVQLLLDEGGDPNETENWYQRPYARSDENLGTALTQAIQNGHTHIVKVLLDNGADVNMRHFDERTPLQLAMDYGENTIVALLIAHLEWRRLEGR